MNKYQSIRQIVRSCYDLQKMRIAMGLRLVSIYRERDLGNVTEESESFADKVMAELKTDYARITDSVAKNIIEEGEDKIPTPKKFKPQGRIETYPDLLMAKMYFDLLKMETGHFKNLEKALKEFPIFTEFLSTIPGVGVQMAGVIISEIDISKSRYPSSVHKYAGLDTVVVGYYTNAKGEEKQISGEDVEKFYESNDLETQMLAEGKYPVYFKQHGRSRKTSSLVTREYTSKTGEVAYKQSITYNPWLKTKLIGVLGPSFLKQTKVTLDGKNTSSANRLEIARAMGFKQNTKSSDSITKQVDQFLIDHGHSVEMNATKYGQIYYDYRHRLEHSPHHTEKTALHKHNMAIRYAVKMFLNDLYREWRTLEGLEVFVPYEEEKLGIVHKERKPNHRPLHPLIEKFAYESMVADA